VSIDGSGRRSSTAPGTAAACVWQIAPGSECEQCRVCSRRRRLNTGSVDVLCAMWTDVSGTQEPCARCAHRQVKHVGWTDMASAERMEPTGESSPNLNRTDPPPLPLPLYKVVGFVSISGATSSKSGVDMSTPVHPVATPLHTDPSREPAFRGGNIWACPDVPAFNILSVIRNGAAAMRPFALSTAATCCYPFSSVYQALINQSISIRL